MRLLCGLFFFFVIGYSPLLAANSGKLVDNDPRKATVLLDPELSHWDNYLSYRFKPGYDGSKPQQDPIGENSAEGERVFSTVIENGNTVLRISGEIYGSIITKASYRNYRLTMDFRWGEQKFDPRKNLLRDTGILYHSVGPHGAEYWRSWMQGQEFQIMEGHIGDFWSQATSAMDIRALTPEYIMNPIGSLTYPFLPVGHEQDIKGFVLRRINNEKPNGHWNRLELVTFEGKSLHIVNGEVVMVLRNSRYKKDGEFKSLLEGKIQLQSEAAEVFYKDIRIQSIATLPVEYIHLFN